jgi:hypothetical protein
MLRTTGSIPRHLKGKFPNISINNNGAIVEVYQPFILSENIYYKVGELQQTPTEEKMDMCEDKTFLDNGRYPKVAISNNRVVEVHEGRVHRYIYYHYGTLDVLNKTITWHENPRVNDLCRGRFPSVAIHEDRVVVTYDHALFGSFTTYYVIGNFGGDGIIHWEGIANPENHKIFDSYGVAETSVAINQHNVVVAGRGWKSIMCRVGKFRGNDAIEFTREISFNHWGYCPRVCLDDDGYIIMVWQSTTLRKLNYATTEIKNPEQQPSISWPQHESVTSYGYGYNPSIAISPVGGHVLEEHETNFAPFRCHLFYHTGVLTKPPVPHNAERIPHPVLEENAIEDAEEEDEGNIDEDENGIHLNDLHLENRQRD